MFETDEIRLLRVERELVMVDFEGLASDTDFTFAETAESLGDECAAADGRLVVDLREKFPDLLDAGILGSRRFEAVCLAFTTGSAVGSFFRGD